MNGYFSPRRYWSVLLIQSARGGLKTSRSTVSSKRFGFVRHVRRDAKNLSGMDNNFTAVDPELQRTIQYVRQLLVVMAVLGDDASLFKQDARHHNFLADHELALQ